jgi:ATP-dependent RNA helicase SUPV3L1/SUV3
MLSFPSGLIGLPLRLLAREVYNRVVARVGAANVALMTGEEKDQTTRASLLGVDSGGDAARY